MLALPLLACKLGRWEEQVHDWRADTGVPCWWQRLGALEDLQADWKDQGGERGDALHGEAGAVGGWEEG